MDLSSLTSQRIYDPWDALFNKYIEIIKPKSNQKAKFGQALGFLHYKDLKESLGASWDESNDKQIREAIDKLGNKELSIARSEVAFNSARDHTLNQCINFFVSAGVVSLDSMKDYQTNHLNEDSPIDLKQAIKEELADQPVHTLELNDNDKNYFINHHWQTLPLATQLNLISGINSLQRVKNLKLKSVGHTLEKLFNAGEHFHTERYMHYTTPCAAKTLYSVYREIVKRKLIEPTELFETVKSRFMELKKSKDEGTAYITFCNTINAVPAEDLEAMSFYNRYCKGDAPKYEPIMQGFGREPEPGYESANIKSLLGSDSKLAPPVIATYLLHTLADQNFNLERLYACLYAIESDESLKPVVKLLEPIEKIKETLSYNDDNLNNDLIAAFILANKVSFINKNDGTQKYADFLFNLYLEERHHLVLSESQRFIELNTLQMGETIFSKVFKQSLAEAATNDIRKMTEKSIIAAAIFARKEQLALGALAMHIDDETLELVNRFVKNPMLSLLSKKTSRQTLIAVIHFDTSSSPEFNQIGINNPKLTKHPLIELFKHSDINFHKDRVSTDLNKSFFKHAAYNDKRIRKERGLKVNYDDYNEKYLRTFRALGLSAKSRNRSKFYQWDVHFNLIQTQVISCAFDCKVRKKEHVINNHISTLIPDNGTLHVFYNTEYDDIFLAIAEHNIHTVIIHKPFDIHTSDKYIVEDGHHKKTGQLESARVYEDTITISNIKPDLAKTILEYHKLIEECKIYRFKDHNPITSVAEKLSPSFQYCGVTINPNGTDYSKFK